MKKLLLTLLVASPFLSNAQVSNPDVVKTFTPTPHTGWTATVDHFDAYGGDAKPPENLIDGNLSTYWETYSLSTPGEYHWAVVNLGSLQTIDSIYVQLRSSQNGSGGNDPHKFVISISPDSATWTKVGDTVNYEGTTVPLQHLFPHSSTNTYKYIRLESYGQKTVNVAEIGLYTIQQIIPDPNAYDRSSWIITSNQATAGGDVLSNLVDGSMDTKWQSAWSGTPVPYPHILTFDMGTVQPVNQILYNTWKSGNFNSAADSGTIAFSTDGTTWGAEIPMKYGHSNGTKDTFSIPGGTQNARYFRLTIVQNYYVANNGTGTTGTHLATSLTEVWADFNKSLPVTFASPLSAKSTGKTINLSWSTATEINTSHFIIQRSTDGIHFSTIGQVNAQGEAHVYNFVDNSPLAGINYYLLVQVDKDGNSHKSIIVSANLNLGIVSNLLVNIGKTIGNTVNLSINSTSASQAIVNVFNLLGQKVASQTVQLNVGSNNVQLNVNGALGIYIVNVTTPTSQINKKFIKL